MRVASNTYSDSLVSQLNTLAERQYRLQTQASTGQRVTTAEEDPAAMRRTLDLQANARTLAQHRENISVLKEQAGATYDVMRGLKKISDRARELATLADDTESQEELQSYGDEVRQLIHRAVELMNGKFRGDYLMGGTRSDQPPFVENVDANGVPTSVIYQGNATVNEAEIAPGTTLSGQSLGENNTGSGPRGLISDNRFGADFFNHLISLQNHLKAGDADAVAATDRAALAKDEENFLFHIATNGAMQSRLEATDSMAESTGTSIDRLVLDETGADLAETLVRLNETQTAYQAALQSGARLMGQSLLDFLR